MDLEEGVEIEEGLEEVVVGTGLVLVDLVLFGFGWFGYGWFGFG